MDRLRFKTGEATSVSLTDLRTPIVDNFLSMLPVGHDKALKYAFYNVIALILAAGVILAFWGVYCILEPFIKALMWAILCGSVLHPFKEQICSFARDWLKSTKRSTTPFTLRLVTSPILVADSISDKIGNYIWKYWKSIIMALVVFFVTYVIYYNPPVTLVAIIQYIVSTMFSIVLWLLSWINGSVVIALNIGYATAIVHYMSSAKEESSRGKSKITPSSKPTTTTDVMDSQSQQQSLKAATDSHKYNLKVLSYLSWFFTLSFICLKLPYPFLFALAVFLAVGTVAYLRNQREKSFRYTLPKISRIACMMVLNIGSEAGVNAGGRRSNSTSQVLSPVAQLLERVRRSHSSSENLTPPGSSTTTFGGLLSRTKKAYGQTEKQPLHRSFSDGGARTPNPIVPTRADTNTNDGLSVQTPNIDETRGQNSMEMPSPVFPASPSMPEDEVDGHGVDSNTFLYGVFCACLIVFIWNRLWLMHLIPIPIVYYGIKRLSSKFGLVQYLDEKVKQPIFDFYFGSDECSQIFIPEPVRNIFQILHAADRKMISICEMYVDPVSSLLVLVLVVLATILGVIFAATQVYAEGDHLVRVSGNLINSTVSQHPEISQYLPEGWQGIMNSMVDNAYIHGREYITNMIRDSVSEADPKKAEHIEKQVIELWDRIYLSWNQTWENAFTNVTKRHDDFPIEDSIEQHGIDWDLVEFSVLANYARANLGTLWSIMDSLWKILLGNISLAISAVTSVLSLLFGGGTAILNLIINTVVFFTALFYLLSSSTSVYKPVEIFNQFSLGSGGSGLHTSYFALACEEAVSSVFVASFKMAAFYGMWTWLIHTLFQVNIVFVPSMFGGLFAAVPFLMPYWAALPAVLELWLIQGQWPKAVFMLLAQMAPMSAVDTQIYSEIKGGGHPYLTGLAVAGGIFCFGFQGAIMGPVILCLVFVAVKVANTFMLEGSDSDAMLGQRLTRRRDFGDRLDNANANAATPTESSK